MTGRKYRLKLRAKNIVGYGPFSDEIEIGLVNAPAKPSPPYKIIALSNSTKITVRWDKIIVPQKELPAGQITSYKLYMDDGLFGNYSLISYASASLS